MGDERHCVGQDRVEVVAQYRHYLIESRQRLVVDFRIALSETRVELVEKRHEIGRDQVRLALAHHLQRDMNALLYSVETKTARYLEAFDGVDALTKIIVSELSANRFDVFLGLRIDVGCWGAGGCNGSLGSTRWRRRWRWRWQVIALETRVGPGRARYVVSTATVRAWLAHALARVARRLGRHVARTLRDTQIQAADTNIHIIPLYLDSD